MQQSILASSNLNTVFEKVNTSWIPAQAKVIDEITSKIYCGFYDNSPQTLYSDLKKDISTFLFTARALPHSSEKLNDKAVLTAIIPLLNELKKRHATPDISSRAVSSFQIEVLHEAIMSATVVSELSAKFSYEEKITYSVAMLRHLGRALLSWNYPHEFREALEVLNKTRLESPLDRVLTNIFGFSPSTLAGKVILEMGFNKEILGCISPELDRKNGTYGKLVSLCHLGEVFAMAHSTINHPIDADETSKVLSILSGQLGEEGIRKIYKTTSRLYEAYSKSYPELYDIHTTAESKTYSKNLYPRIHLTRLARAARIDKKEASAIISMVLEKNSPEELIKRLFHNVLPSMGITSSLVFTTSPLEGTLIPIFKKGSPSFIKPEEVSVYPLEERFNIVRDCFLYSRSHTSSGISPDKKERVFVLQTFPAKQPVGVLYIEGSNDSLSKKDIEYLSRFAGAVMEYLHGINI
jgi:hypothetical protein